MSHCKGLPLVSFVFYTDEWIADNLDYNEIKQLIKRYTTGKPLVQIPELKTAFEDEFFDVFMDQLGRVLGILATGRYSTKSQQQNADLTGDSD